MNDVQRNAQTARDFYTAVAEGTADIGTIATAFAPDAVLHVPGHGTNSGEYVGHEGIAAFLGRAAADSAGTLRLTLHQVLANDETAVALVTYTASRPGRDRSLENNLAHVMRMRDGRIAESWFHSRDQAAADAFWSDESA